MMITFDDYCGEVMLKYEQEKHGDYSVFLLKPSPAELKKFCQLLYDEGFEDSDKKILRNFLQLTSGDDLEKEINDFDSEKFKAMILFLNGKTKRTGQTNMEMIAILTNFQPRPYNKFRKEKINADEPLKSQLSIPNTSDEAINPSFDLVKVAEGSPTKNKSQPSKKVFRILALMLLLSTCYIAKDIYFSEKQCMQWQDSLYVAVNCVNANPKYITTALDKKQLNLKRIYPRKNDPVEKDGQHIVWYYKNNGVEFYNMEGKHPITGKQLLPATWLFLDKHGK